MKRNGHWSCYACNKQYKTAAKLQAHAKRCKLNDNQQELQSQRLELVPDNTNVLDDETLTDFGLLIHLGHNILICHCCGIGFCKQTALAHKKNQGLDEALSFFEEENGQIFHADNHLLSSETISPIAGMTIIHGFQCGNPECHKYRAKNRNHCHGFAMEQGIFHQFFTGSTRRFIRISESAVELSDVDIPSSIIQELEENLLPTQDSFSGDYDSFQRITEIADFLQDFETDLVLSYVSDSSENEPLLESVSNAITDWFFSAYDLIDFENYPLRSHLFG